MSKLGKNLETTVKKVDKVVDNLKKNWEEARKAIEELKGLLEDKDGKD